MLLEVTKVLAVPGLVVERNLNEATSLEIRLSTYCFGAAERAVRGSADSVRTDDVPIMEIDPLTSPPVANGKNLLSTYCFGTASNAATGSWPSVKRAPLERAICAPEERDMTLPEDNAISAPLAIVTFCPSV